MRKLLILVLVAAGLWGGYWLIGARATEAALAAWLEARAEDGWVANYAELRTRGFPNRLDTTIREIELADPETGVAWRAPFFQILSLSYKPYHIIAVWPGRQTIASSIERIAVTSDQMRGSVVFEPGTSLTLDRSSFVLDGLRLASSAGWTAELQQGRFATRQTAVREHSHDIGFEATGLAPPAELLALLEPAGLLPKVVETVRIDATVGFDGPLDRFAVEAGRPAITGLDLNELRAEWGRMLLRATGELSVDAEGVPEGRITVTATNWREMLDIAVAAGVVPPGLKPTAERALGVLAGLGGQPDTLEAPIDFRNGRVSLGPIPLGQAPRLTLR